MSVYLNYFKLRNQQGIKRNLHLHEYHSFSMINVFTLYVICVCNYVSLLRYVEKFGVTSDNQVVK